jgi:hypothetical protein
MTQAEIEIAKTAISGIATVLGAATVGGFGLLTAKRVTARLEAQKQRLDLYKTLYLERIAAARGLTERAGTVYAKSATNHTDASEDHILAVKEANRDLNAWTNANRWLFTPEVIGLSDRLAKRCVDYQRARSVAERQDVLSEMGKYLNDLGDAVSDMMHRDDLAGIIRGGKA